MAEYITLLGAEQVQSAASSMQRAADDMQRAASSMQEAVDRQQRMLDDWLDRLAALLEANRG